MYVTVGRWISCATVKAKCCAASSGVVYQWSHRPCGLRSGCLASGVASGLQGCIADGPVLHLQSTKVCKVLPCKLQGSTTRARTTNDSKP